MTEKDILENVLDPVGQPSGIFGRVTDPSSKNSGVVLDPYRQPTQELSSMEGQLMASRLKSLDGKVVYSTVPKTSDRKYSLQVTTTNIPEGIYMLNIGNLMPVRLIIIH